VAERAAAIGVAPDARATTVAARSRLPQPPADWFTDDAVVAQFVDASAKVIDRMQDRIEHLFGPVAGSP
jgi:starvation-inducible DNA-binding protein